MQGGFNEKILVRLKGAIMLRRLAIAILLTLPFAYPVAAPAGPPATAEKFEARLDHLWETLQLGDLMPILRDEVLAEMQGMQEDLFLRGGTGNWLAEVARIHDPVRLEELFRTGLGAALEQADEARMTGALDFYRQPLGRRLIALENSARVAMLDPDTDAQARAAFAAAAHRGAPRVAQIARLIDRADLIEPNVAGGLNAAIAFSQGFGQGGGFDMPPTEGQMLADAWNQEAGIRVETQSWLEAYLTLAYSPLSDDELERYILFVASPEGRALSAVMFAGFEALFWQTSFDLGLAAAGQLQGRKL